MLRSRALVVQDAVGNISTELLSAHSVLKTFSSAEFDFFTLSFIVRKMLYIVNHTKTKFLGVRDFKDWL